MHDSAANAGFSEPGGVLTLAHLNQLPTLPAVAVQTLQITADRNARLEDLLAVLRGDQSITSRVLAVAASAAVGARGDVSTLERAVVILGFAAVRSIVLAVKVFECFAGADGNGEARGFDRTEFWKHSIGVASAAKRLAAARRALGIDPEEAFVAGLLHDLGKVALDTLFPKAYDRIATQAGQARGDLADLERAVLGADHTVAGRTLAERWRLPAAFREAIWLHHLSPDALPASVGSRGLICLVQLADTLVREQHIGYSGNYAFYESSSELAAQIGIDAPQVESVTQALAGDVAAQVSLLGLDRDTTERVYLRSLTRANGELARLNSELISTNRKLAVAARYHQAAGMLDSLIQAWFGVADVVRAIAQSVGAAVQHAGVTAFGLLEAHGALEIASAAENLPLQTRTCPMSPEEYKALHALRQNWGVIELPAALRSALSLEDDHSDDAEWLVPIPHGDEIVGGIVFRSPRDERLELAGEIDELRGFVTRLGLSLARASALSAARRLSDDLAESNRRLQQVQSELLRSRTLAMIAEMAAGAGHELNGPLTVISGRAQMLAAQLESPDARRALEQISQKAHECSQIVSELMDFARPRPPKFETVELGPLLLELNERYVGALGPAMRVQLNLPGGPAEPPLRVRADREQLVRVLVEVLKNAVEAVRDRGGNIVIEARRATSLLDAGSPPRVRQPDRDVTQRQHTADAPGIGAARAADAGLIEIQVRDPGRGMTPAVLHRAFDPFYSHRPAGRSRGLGLARAHRIIDSHGGRIWLESRAGDGTCVHILLPEAGQDLAGQRDLADGTGFAI
ncbi:MAG: HDOD domain-containing protein [Phycisphaerae bacterium]